MKAGTLYVVNGGGRRSAVQCTKHNGSTGWLRLFQKAGVDTVAALVPRYMYIHLRQEAQTDGNDDGQSASQSVHAGHLG